MAKVQVLQDRKLGPVRPLPEAEPPDGRTWWLVTRYDDVVAAVADERLSNKGLYPTDCAAARLVNPEQTANRVLSRSMIAVDPPDHSRLRKLVSREFSAKNLQSLRPR